MTKKESDDEGGDWRAGAVIRKPLLFCGYIGRAGHIAAPGQEAGNGYIFVDLFPVQARAAEFDLLTLPGRCMQQARKPGERDTERTPVFQIDPETILVKPDRQRFR